MSHTPGPWGVGKGGLIVEASTRMVAATYSSDDARLIAAAPEILSLLEELAGYGVLAHAWDCTHLDPGESCDCNFGDLPERAAALLAKARGTP